MMPVVQSKTKTLKSAFSIDSLMRPDRERDVLHESRRTPSPRSSPSRSPPGLIRDVSPLSNRNVCHSPRRCSSEASSPSSSPANSRLTPPSQGALQASLMGGVGSSFHAVSPSAISALQAAKSRYQDILPGRIPALHGGDGLPPGLRSMVFPPASFPGLPGHNPHPQMTVPPHQNGFNPLLQRDPLYFYNPLLLCNNRGFFNQRLGQDTGLFMQPFRKPKRIRTAFSPSQLLKLEHAFEKNHYVVGQERKELAANLSLTETQVKVWFQNRRTKFKRTIAEKSDGSIVMDDSEDLDGSELDPCGPDSEPSSPLSSSHHPHDFHMMRGTHIDVADDDNESIIVDPLNDVTDSPDDSTNYPAASHPTLHAESVRERMIPSQSTHATHDSNELYHERALHEHRLHMERKSEETYRPEATSDSKHFEQLRESPVDVRLHARPSKQPYPLSESPSGGREVFTDGRLQRTHSESPLGAIISHNKNYPNIHMSHHVNRWLAETNQI